MAATGAKSCIYSDYSGPRGIAFCLAQPSFRLTLNYFEKVPLAFGCDAIHHGMIFSRGRLSVRHIECLMCIAFKTRWSPSCCVNTLRTCWGRSTALNYLTPLEGCIF